MAIIQAEPVSASRLQRVNAGDCAEAGLDEINSE
jgi:hypothetical protein